MLIQKDLEAKVVSALTTALSAANVTGVSVKGAWQTAMSGFVKWLEDSAAATPAFLSVSVGAPAWGTFSTPVVDFAVNFSLFVRAELDPTGAKLCDVASVVEDLLRGWQTSTYQASFTALDLDNLSVDGVNLGGGNSPTVAGANAVVSWNFTLSGSYRESEPTTNN